MALTTHMKGRSKDVTTGEETVTYFTDEEWAAQEQARLAAEAVEAARDIEEEEFNQLQRGVIAFIKVYAEREGLTLKQLKDLVKAKL